MTVDEAKAKPRVYDVLGHRSGKITTAPENDQCWVKINEKDGGGLVQIYLCRLIVPPKQIAEPKARRRREISEGA